jgi:hypothetical protein
MAATLTCCTVRQEEPQPPIVTTMIRIEHSTVLVDQPTTKLQAFRLEDTGRAPAVIVFVDEEKGQLLPLRPGQAPPVTIKSETMEAEIQIIGLDEIQVVLGQK